jgi:polyether ionophore transport system permease protein
MSAEAGAPRHAATFPPIPLHRRLVGLGSIYGKTIRDSRLAFIIAAGVLVGMMLAAGAAMQDVFPTPQSRQEVDTLIASVPASMAGLFGNPVKVGTLPGVINWKYGPFFALGTALWSILALSGTLAGEARRGSLDFVAAAPFGKRRIALEKLAAHLTLLTVTMAILAVAAWATALAFGDESLGDAIPPEAAIGFALWVGLLAIAHGGLAFALAPLLGRSGAAGVAGAALVVGWVANGYSALTIVASLSPFHWTADQAAIVGVYDWPSLLLVAVVAVVLLVIGVELFARRDLGVTLGLSAPGLPAVTLGVQGPVGRAFGDQLPRALGWGIGLGLFGIMLVSLVGSLASQIAEQPQFMDLFRAMFPDFDVTTAGGFLQFYAQILFIVAGYAGATFVSRWASDETEGRLEMVLSTPLARARWVIAGGIGAFGAVVVMNVLLALGIGIGAVSSDVEAVGAMAGSASLGLYALAAVGVGIAVGGLWRTSLAAEIAAVLVTATFLVDLLAPPLELPDWFHHLALTANMGQPMTGHWDVVGIVACLAIAAGGVALGAWGFARRDVTG